MSIDIFDSIVFPNVSSLSKLLFSKEGSDYDFRHSLLRSSVGICYVIRLWLELSFLPPPGVSRAVGWLLLPDG